MRDTARFLRRALHGDPVGTDYTTFTVGGFALRTPPRTPPRVIVAALRPRMLELAFTEADGAITNLLTAGDITKVVSAIRVPRGDREFIVKIFVCPTADASQARLAGRRFLGWILNQDVYRKFHDWLGRGEALAESHQRFLRGDADGAGAALPEQLVDELWVHGTFAQCRERIARYLHPAVTTVVLYLAATPELRGGAVRLEQVLAELSPRTILATARSLTPRNVGVVDPGS
jgi:alkanesulfonate monooxygenase SsuD/methylene tetrahydromethanopterin reductase-like flavin-dependent oxidoreductase (luciferase family)